MSNGTFSTVLTAPLSQNGLTATIADDPTSVVVSPAYFVIESGSGPALLREFIFFDGTYNATQLVASSIDRRYLSGSTASSGITHPAGSTVRMVRAAAFTPSHWCSDQDRVDIAATAGLNGIEFVEVISSGTQLEVHLLTADPSLDAANFVLTGGDVETDLLITGAVVAGSTVTLDVDRPGDHSQYRLNIVSSGTGESSGAPADYDPILSTIQLRFHVDESSRFDCRHEVYCPPAPKTRPAIDYLAKDYPAFRRAMLDRIALHLDLDRDPNAADLVTTVIEGIAYRADHLSYYQDAVATEAYLGTARRRESIRRHARMLDYRLAEGCNARAWIAVTVGADNEYQVEVELPGPDLGLLNAPLPFAHDPTGAPGTRFLVGLPTTDKVKSTDVDDLVRDGVSVFESLHPIVARSAHNRIQIYTWGDNECCLPQGTTTATLLGDPLDDPLRLAPGDVVILEEVLSPQTGTQADANPTKRHAVRLTRVEPVVDPAHPEHSLATVHWHELDALPFALCISARLRLPSGQIRLVEDLTVVRGNVVLADHGYRTAEQDDPTTPHAFEGLPPVPDAPAHLMYRPLLRAAELTIAAPYSHDQAQALAASDAIATDWRTAIPAVWAETGTTVWRPRPDLLASDRFAHEFTVEMTDIRRAYLRFGDNIYGRAPLPGDVPAAVYRVGTGPGGNVGADSITTIVDDGIVELRVRNPLAASGGRQFEPVDVVRRDAPQAFRIQQRAVTAADYAEVAERHGDVVRAAATRRWTGSWHTMYLTVDRRLGLDVDAEFEAELRAFLERFRLSGHDLEIDGPRFVPLDIAFSVRVAAGFHVGDVETAVRKRLSARMQDDGRAGFFHPDRFSFGEPVYLSQLLAVVAEVPGVAWVDLGKQPSSGHRFDRLFAPDGNAIDQGFIGIGRLEIAQLDATPDHPDRGRLELLLEEAS